MQYEILRLEHVARTFSGGLDLKDISFNLFRGELVCIAARGYSSIDGLIQILTGSVICDSGTIFLDDSEIIFRSSTEARRAGIFYINEEDDAIPNMCIAVNMFLTDSNYYLLSSITKRRKMQHDTRALLDSIGLEEVSPNTKFNELDRVTRFILEMEKAVLLGARILILNQLSSIFSDRELDRIMQAVTRISSSGVSILYLTNKYSPILTRFSRVFIIRNGISSKILTEGEIERRCFEDCLVQHYIPPIIISPEAGRDSLPPVILESRGIHIGHIKQFSFSLRRGERLGIWCENINLDQQFYDMLTGPCHALPPGTILVDGKILPSAGKKAFNAHGVALLPSITTMDNIFSNLSIQKNIVLNAYKCTPKRLLYISRSVERHLAEYYAEKIHAKYLLKKYSTHKHLSYLDECDIMRIVIARWLCAGAKTFIFANPYTYMDTETLHVFRNLLEDLTSCNVSVLLTSTDKNSLFEVCNRVISLSDGAPVSPY